MKKLRKAPVGVESVLFLYKGKSAKANIIPNIDEILWEYEDSDGTTRTVKRAIRYVPGESSIFMDEQSDKADKRRGKIVFRNGRLNVSVDDVMLVKYLMNFNGNGDNPGRVRNANVIIGEFQRGKLEAERIEKLSKVVNLQVEVLRTPIKDLKVFLTSCGFNTDILTDAEVQNNALNLAERDPDAYKNAQFNKERGERKYNIIEAMKKGIIERSGMEIYWGNGGNLICTSTIGQDAADAFVSFSYTRTGEQAYIDMLNKLNPSEYAGAKVTSVNNDKEYKDILERGIDSGALRKEGHKYILVTAGRGKHTLGVNQGDAISNMMGNPTLKQQVEERIQEKLEKSIYKE